MGNQGPYKGIIFTRTKIVQNEKQRIKIIETVNKHKEENLDN